MKLHLGCGGVKLEGYLNVDVRPEVKPDLVADLTGPRPWMWSEDDVDEIASFHVLEHLSRPQAAEFLFECHDLLRNGGRLVLELPDAKQAAREWLAGNEDRKDNLWGLQRNPYDFHRWGYDPDSLKAELEEIGFEVTHVGPGTDYHAKEEPCFRIEARKP